MSKWCYSKKIVAVSYLITTLLTVFCSIALILGLDISSFTVIVGLAWAETASANAFYFWKAKNENRIKLTQKMVSSLANKYGIEAVISLADIVIKE
jgi:hypothetical protein